MKYKVVGKIICAALWLLGSSAMASTTWYVNGVSGSDSNDCLSPTIACKTIGHAISLASSGDSVKVAAAIYTENLTIGFNLRVSGSGARTFYCIGCWRRRPTRIFAAYGSEMPRAAAMAGS